MKPEIFAEFLERNGHHIYKTESCYWYDAQPGFLFYFPYHRLINPSPQEVKEVFRNQQCIGMRFFTPMEYIGKSSYLIECSDKNYDLTSISSSSARKDIRRGLENFEIRQMEFKDLATLGISLNYDTLARQGRAPHKHAEKRWRNLCSAAEGLDGLEAWGAFRNGKLGAYVIGIHIEDYFTIMYLSSATKYMHLRSNHALIFELTRLKLALPEVNTVCGGPQSLDAPAELETFKFRLGYQKRPMKQRIVFNPLIRPFIGGTLHKFVKFVVRVRPQSDFFRKTEGVIRYYRESD
jgi:hypothetical protein